MAARPLAFALVVANVLVPIAILTFASGFFPYKPFLPGLAQFEPLQYGPLPGAPFDRLIFMVVDALRSDFVYGASSGFRFTQSLISSGAAIPFTAHATSPTITMPRIKAITTGSIPSFLDVILNFAELDTSSTLAAQDTWLTQLKQKRTGKMVMFGDDTWLKLFPETFDRADGTSSFFVSDFTEVDQNVTRHVPEELENQDWSTIVLHYLGLDHIGHKAGPRSPNMIPKQQEMDDIVSQIYEAIISKKHLQSTLLVLLGDHGMNDAGNHGGSAPGETSPALIFISPKLKTISSGSQVPAPFQEDFRYYSTVEQSDIAPTLGALLGFPVPKNNLGTFIPQFLSLWPRDSDKIQILLRNAKQIRGVITATFPSFENDSPSRHCDKVSSSIDELACRWRDIMKGQPCEGEGLSETWQASIIEWLKIAQEIMSSAASNYNVFKLVAGLAIAVVALVLSIIAARPIVTTALSSSSPLIGICLMYGFMMFASSYVEEEQHFWYWVTSAWLALLCIKCTRQQRFSAQFLVPRSVVLLLATRVSRRWNQTGQKFAGEPDIAKAFFSKHRIIFWLLVIPTYLWSLQSLRSEGFPRIRKFAAGAIATILSTTAFTFKFLFTNQESPELIPSILQSKLVTRRESDISLTTRARFVFSLLGLVLLYTLMSGLSHTKKPNPTMRTTHDLLTLLLITQSRATNVPLVLVFEILHNVIYTMDLDLIETTTTSLLLQYMSFFAFGGSNAISSIDLSNAYNGVNGYNVLVVGILTFIGNWTGPVFWSSAMNLMLLRLYRAGETHIFSRHLTLLTVFVTSSLFFVMAACTILRMHLFIWTVFSPKYLYSMAWGLGQHLCINVGFGSVLFWMGTKYS